MRTLGTQGNKVIAGILPSFLFALIHIVDLLFGSVDMFLVLISETIVGILFSIFDLETGDIVRSSSLFFMGCFY